MSPVALLVVTVAVSVPPGALPHNHNQPYHNGTPVVRRFERKPVDDYRRTNWETYTRDLDVAWRAYRRAGSTEAAFAEYKQQLHHLRRDYLYNDPYYVTVESTDSMVADDGAACCDTCGAESCDDCGCEVSACEASDGDCCDGPSCN